MPFPSRSTARALVALTAITATAIMATACGGDGAPRRFLSIGTGGTGGVYYPLGGALASQLSLRDSTRQFTAEVTGGSVENVNRILAGQIDLGFTLAVTAYEAYHGGQDFDQPAPNLRIVAPLYANVTHVMVSAGSSARSLEDLRGMRVSVGSAGSGTEQISRQLMEVHEMTYEDFDARYLTFTESASALRDGAIDAAILSVGIPAAAVLEASTTGAVRLLPISSERMAELKQRYPYYSAGTIPAGAYPGVTEAVPAAAMMNWLVADASLDAEVVGAVLDVLEDEGGSLRRVHDMAGQIDLARLADAPIPVHDAVAGRGG